MNTIVGLKQWQEKFILGSECSLGTSSFNTVEWWLATAITHHCTILKGGPFSRIQSLQCEWQSESTFDTWR